MIVITVSIVAGLALALGGCMNRISELKWEKENIEAHARELERQINKIKPILEHKESFKAFDLRIDDIA